ncbi:MAG: hypothetical protein PWQ57_3173 [Desulfovibrionales bacterium]|nr:hypothetical protein [Desulfovibrionales bacterium]
MSSRPRLFPGVGRTFAWVAIVAWALLAIAGGCSFSEDVVAPVEKLFEPPPSQHAVRVLLLPDDADQESLPHESDPYRTMYRAAWLAMKGAGLNMGGSQELPHNIRISGREAPQDQAILDVSRVKVWDYIALVSYYPLLSFPQRAVQVQAEGKIRIIPVQWKGPTIPVRFTSTISSLVGAHPDKGDIMGAMTDMSGRVGKDVGDELARRIEKLAELHPPQRGLNATGLSYDGRMPDTWELVRSFRPYATFVPFTSKPERDEMRKNLGVKRLTPSNGGAAGAGGQPPGEGDILDSAEKLQNVQPPSESDVNKVKSD